METVERADVQVSNKSAYSHPRYFTRPKTPAFAVFLPRRSLCSCHNTRGRQPRNDCSQTPGGLCDGLKFHSMRPSEAKQILSLLSSRIQFKLMRLEQRSITPPPKRQQKAQLKTYIINDVGFLDIIRNVNICLQNHFPTTIHHRISFTIHPKNVSAIKNHPRSIQATTCLPNHSLGPPQAPSFFLVDSLLS